MNTRLNSDFVLYIKNHIRKFLFKRSKSVEITFPTNAMIELGNVCNLRCRMCPRVYEYGKEMDVGFMPLENAKRIVDEIYPYLDSIGLTGLGETTLYPHLLEIVKYIKSKKKSIIITISTNAHIKGYKEKIVPILDYIDNIQFSVDGVDKVFESIRGVPFSEVNDNIKFTKQRGNHVTFMLNCVVMPENYHQMQDVVEYARHLKINYVNFNCVSISSRPNESREYYKFFQSDEYLNAVQKLKILAKRYHDMEITGPFYPQNGTFQDCIYPWEYPYISWDGFYVPCCGKPFPKLLNFGNVFEAGVMAVLNGEKAQSFRKLWQKNEPPMFCHNCQLTNL